jgi:Xaa-Pro dipeptidase
VLIAHEIITCSLEQALLHDIPSLFMPHGVGHLLGIQVHDAGGHLANEEGEVRQPPAEFPFLRNTRPMEQGMVFTVEPGLYFIPVLLNPERNSVTGKFLNWNLIDELLPLGGIRIEDNVLVEETKVINLTRQ